MGNKKILLPAFVFVALLQLIIPSKMIWDRERVLSEGKEFKFKTAPVDPYDPFRGKYITLTYQDNEVWVDDRNDWGSGEEIYVYLKTDNEGFSAIKSASKEKPDNDQDFLKVKVRNVYGQGPGSIFIEYPFDRYYMEESKANEAEVIYRQSQQDTTKITYALVSIKNGESVLKDVIVDGTPIRELVIKNRD